MIIFSYLPYKNWSSAGQIELVGDAPVRRVLASLGGWPVVEGEWKEEGWSLELTLGKLRGFYNSPVLVRMMVATDDKNSSVRIVQVVFVCLRVLLPDALLHGLDHHQHGCPQE